MHLKIQGLKKIRYLRSKSAISVLGDNLAKLCLDRKNRLTCLKYRSQILYEKALGFF